MEKNREIRRKYGYNAVTAKALKDFGEHDRKKPAHSLLCV